MDERRERAGTATAVEGPLVPRTPNEGTRDGPRAWVEYAAFRAAIALGAALPAPAVAALAGGAARVARRVDRRHSDAARRTLAAALGAETDERRREELVLASWRYVLRLGALAAREAQRPPPTLEAFELELAPEVERIAAEGRGALLVGPHLGNLIAGAAGLAALGFRPLHVVSRPVKNRPVSRYVQLFLERQGLHLIPRHGALATSLRVLRGGGSIVALNDQRGRIRPVVAPYFGQPARTEQGFAALARRAGVPIVVVACLFAEGPRPHRLVASAALDPDEVRARTNEEIAAWSNHELEGLVRRAPEQYLWLHDRFRRGSRRDARRARARDEPRA